MHKSNQINLNLEGFHTRPKFKIRMIILITDHANDGILASTCVCKLESRRLISIAKFKCWSRGVQISQLQLNIAISNLLSCENALRSINAIHHSDKNFYETWPLC